MGEAIRALSGMREVLVENRKVMQEGLEDTDKLLGDLDEQSDRVSETLKRASARLKESREEMGRLLLQTTVGTEEEQVNRLDALAGSFMGLPAALKEFNKWGKDTVKIISQMGIWDFSGKGAETGVEDAFKTGREAAAALGTKFIPGNKASIYKKEMEDLGEKSAKWFNKIYQDEEKKLISKYRDEKQRLYGKVELEDKLVLLQDEIELYQAGLDFRTKTAEEEQKLLDFAEQLVNTHNKAETANGERTQQLTAQQLVIMAQRGEWEKIYRITRDTIAKGDNLYDLAKKTLALEKEKSNELKRQDQQLRSMVFRYEEADEIEQERIREASRMMDYTAEELERAYDSSPFMAQVIRDFSNLLNPEALAGLQKSLAGQLGLGPLDSYKFPGQETTDAGVQIESILFDATFEALQIDVNVGGPVDEWVEVIVDQVKRGILDDNTFKDALVNYFRPRA